MKAFLALGLLLLSLNTFAASAVDGDQSLDKVRTHILKYKEVNGNFKQVRNLKDLKLSLESEGDFRFKLPFDLDWNQKKPFVMDLLMTPDKIVQKNADGSEQVITKAQQPVIFTFSSSFLGIFAGDKTAIEKTFTYQVSLKGNKWMMNLEPKDELLKKAVSKVQINGAEFVETVEVTEKSGNTTHIQFSKVKGH